MRRLCRRGVSNSFPLGVRAFMQAKQGAELIETRTLAEAAHKRAQEAEGARLSSLFAFSDTITAPKTPSHVN